MNVICRLRPESEVGTDFFLGESALGDSVEVSPRVDEMPEEAFAEQPAGAVGELLRLRGQVVVDDLNVFAEGGIRFPQLLLGVAAEVERVVHLEGLVEQVIAGFGRFHLRGMLEEFGCVARAAEVPVKHARHQLPAL